MINYYKIIKQNIQPSKAEFIVELQADCPVYEGHFPGNPVAPGACNIEMIRECASIALGKEVRIAQMKVCKFLMLLQPQNQKELTLQLSWTESNCTAIILANDTIAVQLKMIFA